MHELALQIPISSLGFSQQSSYSQLSTERGNCTNLVPSRTKTISVYPAKSIPRLIFSGMSNIGAWAKTLVKRVMSVPPQQHIRLQAPSASQPLKVVLGEGTVRIECQQFEYENGIVRIDGQERGRVNGLREWSDVKVEGDAGTVNLSCGDVHVGGGVQGDVSTRMGSVKVGGDVHGSVETDMGAINIDGNAYGNVSAEIGGVQVAGKDPRRK